MKNSSHGNALVDTIGFLATCLIVGSIFYGIGRFVNLSAENRTLVDKVREKISSAHDCAACHTNYIFTITKYSDNNILINIDIK